MDSFKRPYYVEALRAETRGLPPPDLDDYPEEQMKRTNDLFNIQSANYWLQSRKSGDQPKPLFGDFWLQNELCILFADTNMGKSLLAVHLADSLARGKAIYPFGLDVPPQTVLYLDFELSSAQFGQRYAGKTGSHRFPSEFYRAEYNVLNRYDAAESDFMDEISAAISGGIRNTGATVLIIDNITCLRRGLEASAGALPLMQQLNKLKTRHGLSILVLAHTPKRSSRQPLSRNDLHGSKMLLNFADAAIAMGESHAQPGMRYLKQVKQRSTIETYGTANVCLGRFERRNHFLQFVFSGYGKESEHLYRTIPLSPQDLHIQAHQLKADGLTQREIARKLDVAVGTVNKTLKKPTIAGMYAYTGGSIPLHEFF